MARDIKLVYVDDDNVAGIDFTQNNGIVSGKENLVQFIVKKILTMKGSNSFEQSIGSNFTYLPGGTYSGAGNSTFKTNLNLAVRDLETEVKQTQSEEEDNGTVYSDSEKLQKLRLSSSKFLISTGQWKVVLDIYTEDDDLLTISLSI